MTLIAEYKHRYLQASQLQKKQENGTFLFVFTVYSCTT